MVESLNFFYPLPFVTFGPGLEFIHDHKIIHRDIKPANIMMKNPDGSDSKPHPLITDFGEATFVDETNEEIVSFRSRIADLFSKIKIKKDKNDNEKANKTKTATATEEIKINRSIRGTSIYRSIRGTSIYMAKEIGKRIYDQKVDIYALVLSYYQCKNYNPTGLALDSEERKAYDNAHWNPKAIIEKQLQEKDIEKFTFSTEKYLKNWKDFLVKGTNDDPKLRPSATEIRRNLTNPNTAIFLGYADSIGINPRKNPENYLVNIFAKIVLPIVMLGLAIYFGLVGLAMILVQLLIHFKFYKAYSYLYFFSFADHQLCLSMLACSKHEHFDKDARSCVANTCLCDNGTPINSTTDLNNFEKNCQKNSDYQRCFECKEGFHLVNASSVDSSEIFYSKDGEGEYTCQQNICTCEYGEDATGKFCNEHNSAICHKCDYKYSFTEKRACAPTSCNLQPWVDYETCLKFKSVNIDLGKPSIKLVHENFFKNMSSVTSLTIDGSNFETHNDNFFEGQAHRIEEIEDAFCTLKKLRHLTLYHAFQMIIDNAAEIGVDFASNYEEIIGKKFRFRPYQFSCNTELQTLRVPLGHVGDLHSNQFVNNTKLELIDFSGNEITKLPPTLVRECRKLKTIKFEGNLIKSVPKNFLENQPDLQEINLAYNHIKAIDPNIFTSNHKLVSIDFSVNDINEIDETVISKLSVLESINLGNNNLTIVPEKMFRSNPKLQRIDFANKVTEFETDLNGAIIQTFPNPDYAHSYENRSNLTSSSSSSSNSIINNNKIKMLPNKLVSNNPNLLEFKFSNNEIEDVPKDLFDNNKKLQEIALDGNEIEEISVDEFENLSDLQSFKIERNPLSENTKHQLQKLEESVENVDIYEFDECESGSADSSQQLNVCENGGICSLFDGNMKCDCSKSNYEGPYCQTPKCDKFDCQNGGVCKVIDGIAGCDCSESEYVGKFCTEFNCGEKNPCQNDGICLPPGEFICDCSESDYTGDYCQNYVPSICELSIDEASEFGEVKFDNMKFPPDDFSNWYPYDFSNWSDAKCKSTETLLIEGKGHDARKRRRRSHIGAYFNDFSLRELINLIEIDCR